MRTSSRGGNEQQIAVTFACRVVNESKIGGGGEINTTNYGEMED